MATLKNTTVSGTGAAALPRGTYAQRPSAANGMMRFNSNTGTSEIYTAANTSSSTWAAIQGHDIVKQNLLLWYDFGDLTSYSQGGSTTVKNLVRGNYNGSISNTTPSYSGANQGFIALNGINDIVSTALSINTTPALQPWSYEVWTQIASWPTAVSPANQYGSTTRSGVLLGATLYGGAALYWYGSAAGNASTMYAFLRGNDAYRVTSGYAMALNTWYQFVMVNDYPNAIRLYVNGSEYSNTSCATQDYNSSLVTGLTIGLGLAQVDGGGEQNYSSYPGRISTAKIYGAALSAAQVFQNFTAERHRFGI